MSYLKYFGTDGIRGRVGYRPITPDFVLKLGWAAGKILSRCNCNGSDRSNQVIIGKDTRISGCMLESALESGLAAAGLSVALTGPMPTPAIAYLTRTFRATAGIVISASHNPFYDNGIKFFSITGVKLDSQLEYDIEMELNKELICFKSKLLGKVSRIVDAAGRYIEFCKGTFPTTLNLRTLKIVVDCANGATYHIAPSVFRELGANVVAIACNPNGININKACGSTDIRQLQRQVLLNKADLGIAYDGDGDRVIMVDHFGNRVNGDQMLYILAKEYIYKKKIVDEGIVGTIMSNTGLVIALKRLNIPFVQADIGDRCVLSMLQEKGWNIGGESSGHIVLLDRMTTGDGIVVTLQILSIMIKNCMSLYELCNDIFLVPQISINVYYTGLENILKSNLVKRKIQIIEQELFNKGRIVLRKSGTEPYIRIMVEGTCYNKILHVANRISSIIKAEIKSIDQ